MKTKVILINSPSSLNYNPELSVSYPLGLMYMASALEQRGIRVKIIDFIGVTNRNYIRDTLKINDADIFGISMATHNRFYALRTIDIIKSMHKDARIVLGGIHATLFYNEILENAKVDAVFLGEGDFSFAEYAVNPDLEKTRIPGIAFKDTCGEIVHTEIKWIDNLDTIPKPAFHLIDFRKYKNRLNEMDFHIITARGCPFKCNFCSLPVIYNGRYRVHSISRILEELELLQSIKENGRVMLHDDLFTIDTERTRQLCNGIIRKNIKLKWVIRSRVDAVELKTLKLMKESGCEEIFYGVESGSPQILRNMNKGIEIEEIRRAFRLTRESGIKAISNIMLGYPGEDKHTLNETRRLLLDIRPDKVYFSAATIFPGTQLYYQSVKAGIINDQFWLKNKNKLPYYNEKMNYFSIFWNIFKMIVSLESNLFKKIHLVFGVIYRQALTKYLELRSLLFYNL